MRPECGSSLTLSVDDEIVEYRCTRRPNHNEDVPEDARIHASREINALWIGRDEESLVRI